MLTRRNLLLATTTALPLTAIGAGAARALSTEPMVPADREALAASCRAATSHDDLVLAMRRILDGEVASGRRAADYQATISCPFCRCGLTVTSGRAL